jgi:ATP-dependent DNA helicase RecG
MKLAELKKLIAQEESAFDGRPYIRNQSTTKRMSKEEYIYLHNKNNLTLWEGLTSNTCTLKDLDHNKIREVVRIGVSEKRLPEEAMVGTIQNTLKKLGLMIDNELTNAAVVLFCKNEHKQFMQSTLQLARFKGITKSEFLNHKIVRSNIFDLLEKAMDFLAFALPVAARIEPNNPNRVEIPAIPYSVLRETLTNALIHRDYSYPGASIAVAVYDDRVTISNPGPFPPGVSVQHLTCDHTSIQRNPLIAQIFYVCRKIERWGRGTLDMIRESKKVGNPLPIFEEIGGSFSVTLPLREPIPTIIYEKPKPAGASSLTNRQKEIIKALQQKPLKTPQIMDKMNIKIPTRTIKWELAKLREMQLIKSEGKTKAVLWSLK